MAQVTPRMRNVYRFLTQFAFPACLGAALAWEVQAVTTFFEGAAEAPTVWSLLLGLWFILYLSVWYCFHLQAAAQGAVPEKYSAAAVVADFFDLLVLLSGFGVLGFASGHYNPPHGHLALFAVTLLMLSAAIMNYPRRRPTREGLLDFFLVFGMICLVPILGVYVHYFQSGGDAIVNWGVIVVLYLILVAYVSDPAMFSSMRDQR